MTRKKQPVTDELPAIEYSTIIKAWTLCDHWPLSDALRFLVELPPRSLATEEPDRLIARRIKIFYEIALNCLDDSLPSVELNRETDEPHVRPREFLKWAQEKELPCPEDWVSAVERAHGPLAPANAGTLRRSARHQERCKAIAAYLWTQIPDLTITKMAKRSELKKFGCEGHTYTPKTLENWIRDQCPAPKRGRRPAS